MTGGGDGLGKILSIAAPAALMMIPGVGEALAPALAAGVGGLGIGADTAATAASYLAPALMGGALSGGTAAITGGNPLQAALLGGIGSGLGAGLTGEAGTAASGISGVGDAAAADGASFAPLDAIDSSAISPGTQGLVDSFAAQQAGGAGATAATGAPGSSSMLGNLGKWASKNPLQAAMLGNVGVSSLEQLLPKKQVDVAGNANAVKATSPNWNATIPQYSMNNTAAPYTGDWYKYGLTPQAPLYNAMPQPMMKRGGQVRRYAPGGAVAPASPLPMPQQAQRPAGGASPAMNPLVLKSLYNAGQAIGKHIRKHGGIHGGARTPDGQVHGPGGGQDDMVPAKLSQDEYVLSADIPAALGDGSSSEGAKILDKFAKNVRAHKTSNKGGFPPKAKNPLAYLPKGAM